MTPLGFAQSLATDLATLPLPTPAHAQLGDIVVDCAGTYVTGTTLTEFPIAGDGAACGFVYLQDFIVIAARDCAHVANADGTTNWEAQNAVSAQMDIDAQVLWDWADKQRAAAWVATTLPALTFMITGGIAAVTLNLQLPIP